MQLNFEGIAVGAASLLIIGAFHPLVIWCEYHFTQRVWPVFWAAGLLCLCAALFVQGLLSIVLGLRVAACIWSIRELKEQEVQGDACSRMNQDRKSLISLNGAERRASVPW